MTLTQKLLMKTGTDQGTDSMKAANSTSITRLIVFGLLIGHAP
jgi:hypothetical protein